MVSRRALEVATALLTGAFGVAIVASSFEIGVRWTSRGVGSGAFPAIAGVLIVAGSLYNLVRGAAHRGPAMLDGTILRRIAAVLLPAMAFVAAIPLAGLHVAAAVYMFGSALAHRGVSLAKAAALGLATPAALYAIFDWGFSVPLPRGLLGAALGF